MKNILITAGIVASAAATVLLVLRNRKMTAAAMEAAHGEIHHGKKALRDYIRKSQHKLERQLS